MDTVDRWKIFIFSAKKKVKGIFKGFKTYTRYSGVHDKGQEILGCY